MTSSELHSPTHQQGKKDARHAVLLKPFRLAGWLVEPALNRISHAQAGERHLEPRLMKLLCYLAANQGEVLAREELVAELWPHVIVNENSLTRAVSELRKHLTHEQLDTRDLIQTVPKRGYLLTGRVVQAQPLTQTESVTADPVVVTDSATESGTAARLSNKPWSLLQQPLAAASSAAALSICLTLAIGFDISRSETADTPLLSLWQDELIPSDEPLYGAEISLSAAWSETLPAGTIEKPAVAADGERFAFIKHDLMGSAIYLGELNSEESPMLVFQGPCEISNLTWSPLGDALLFAREPMLTPAALFNAHANGQTTRELFSLNLSTLELSKLVEDTASDAEQETPAASLTYAPLDKASEQAPAEKAIAPV